MDGPKIAFTIFGLNVTETILIGWLVIAFVTVLCLWLTHDLKEVPTKKQAVAEYIVNFFNNMVKENMGEKFTKYTPYIAAIFIYCIFGSYSSLFGFRTSTADINTTFTLAIMTTLLIMFNRFKFKGFFGFFKGYVEPAPIMLPFNILGDISTPVSMAFRMFGNIVGGTVISGLIYTGLIGLSKIIGLSVPIFGVGIPAVLSIYFDLFSGFMQAYIFTVLTMVNIGGAAD